MPLAVQPDWFRFLIVDRKEDGSEVFAGRSTRGVEAREGCTEELMYGPTRLLACFRAVPHAFASLAETGAGLVAHGAQTTRASTRHDM